MPMTFQLAPRGATKRKHKKNQREMAKTAAREKVRKEEARKNSDVPWIFFDQYMKRRERFKDIVKSGSVAWFFADPVVMQLKNIMANINGASYHERDKWFANALSEGWYEKVKIAKELAASCKSLEYMEVLSHFCEVCDDFPNRAELKAVVKRHQEKCCDSVPASDEGAMVFGAGVCGLKRSTPPPSGEVTDAVNVMDSTTASSDTLIDTVPSAAALSTTNCGSINSEILVKAEAEMPVFLEMIDHKPDTDRVAVQVLTTSNLSFVALPIMIPTLPAVDASSGLSILPTFIMT